MARKQKLELTWIGKENRPRLEPRILLEDPDKSYHAAHRVTDDDIFDNLLIHGDNLLALKTIERQFAGKVKCIYIDPPYNTGQAFEHYDDGIETSLWLTLMRERIALLRKLLRPDGVLFVQIDDNYFAHLKLVLDEVFGASRYINTIAVKTKESSGASGGGEDKRLKKNIEFLLAYGGDDFTSFNDVFNEVELGKYLEMMRIEDKSFKYTTVLYKTGKKEFVKTIKDGSGNDMKLYRVSDYETRSLARLAKDEGLTEVEAISKYYEFVHTTENAQTSIRTRVQEATDENDTMYALEYYPVSGRNKGKLTELLFVGPKKRLVSWFKNVTYKDGDRIFKKERIGTFWENLNWNNVTREGGVRFPNGQKPEKLVGICIDLATNEGDLVLDSFLGSGTTAAVAHKMKRQWIGIELGDHCVTHCCPRLKSVIDADDSGGITSITNWKGGGGYRYYRLAPSLLQEDEFGNWIINKKYNPEMLAEAMCKLEGFTYAPSADFYWQHGHSTETDFIYVTTQTLTREQLVKLSDEVGPNRSLLICCGAYRIRKLEDFPNLTLKKIPLAVMSKCEWGKDDYSLEIKALPDAPEPEPDEFEEVLQDLPKNKRKARKVLDQQASLFALEDAE